VQSSSSTHQFTRIDAQRLSELFDIVDSDIPLASFHGTDIGPIKASSFLASRRSAPPIYETYVLERLGERLADERLENVKSYMRRKQVAAFLAIFSEFRLSKLPFVGATTIVSMSDKCIRDYLELMGAIFAEALARGEIQSLDGLTRRKEPISDDTQREGVRASSKAKFDGIRNSFERDWAEATRAVEFIGKLTARLQSNHASLTTLATPERGNFHFDLDALRGVQGLASQRRDFVLRLLRRCEADGLLRPARHGLMSEEKDGQDLTFHLHRRFASFFGFSYRGPYGLVKMPMEEFAEVCDSSFESSVDEFVSRAYAKIVREASDDHPRLF
jgi:hypothetical protein